MRSPEDLRHIRAASIRRNLALCRDFALLCIGADAEGTAADTGVFVDAFNILSAHAGRGDLTAIDTYAFDWWTKEALVALGASAQPDMVASLRPLAAKLEAFSSLAMLSRDDPTSPGQVETPSAQVESRLLAALRIHPPLPPDAAIVELDRDWADNVESWTTGLRDAAHIIACSSTATALVTCFVGALVPIHNRSGYAHKSTSMAALPGAIFLSQADSHQMLAEAIVHEADHQYLYQLTTLAPLLVASRGNKAEIYRSPWRPDPRPAHGLLFGASAFSRVAACFIQAMPSAEPELASSLGRRATLAVRQALDATATMRSRCAFEAEGERFLADLEDELACTRDRLTAAPDWSRWESEAAATMEAAESQWERDNSGLLSNMAVHLS
jgi:hypothetical protein